MLYQIPFDYVQSKAKAEKFQDQPSDRIVVAAPRTQPSSSFGTALISLFTIAWIVLGISAFIMSLVCFGRSGSLPHQVIGFILAVLVGPFYWIYFMVVQSYCKKRPNVRGRT